MRTTLMDGRGRSFSSFGKERMSESSSLEERRKKETSFGERRKKETLSPSLLKEINVLVGGEGNMSQNQQILHQHGKDEGHFQLVSKDTHSFLLSLSSFFFLFTLSCFFSLCSEDVCNCHTS